MVFRIVLSLENSPLFKRINSFSPAERYKMINDHGLLGIFYPDSQHFKKQRLANFHKLELAYELTEKLKGIPHAFIKGVSFLDNLYPKMGHRFMSDIDLISLNNQILHPYLIELGFTKKNQTSWLGNYHKEEWVHNKSQIVLEIQDKFFWHNKKIEDLKTIVLNNGLNTLEPHYHFVYLAGHYAFQHTCQKLYWLLDLELFLRHYEEELQSDLLITIAHNLKLKRAFSFSLKALEAAFNRKNKENFNSTVISDDLFFEDSLSPYNLYLKFSLKDSLVDHLKYNIFWIKNLVQSKML